MWVLQGCRNGKKERDGDRQRRKNGGLRRGVGVGVLCVVESRRWWRCVREMNVGKGLLKVVALMWATVAEEGDGMSGKGGMKELIYRGNQTGV